MFFNQLTEQGYTRTHPIISQMNSWLEGQASTLLHHGSCTNLESVTKVPLSWLFLLPGHWSRKPHTDTTCSLNGNIWQHLPTVANSVVNPVHKRQAVKKYRLSSPFGMGVTEWNGCKQSQFLSRSSTDLAENWCTPTPAQGQAWLTHLGVWMGF